jgi:hypothetical protein
MMLGESRRYAGADGPEVVLKAVPEAGVEQVLMATRMQREGSVAVTSTSWGLSAGGGERASSMATEPTI